MIFSYIHPFLNRVREGYHTTLPLESSAKSCLIQFYFAAHERILIKRLNYILCAHLLEFADKELQEKDMVPCLDRKAKIDLGLRNPSVITPILNASATLKAVNKNAHDR